MIDNICGIIIPLFLLNWFLILLWLISDRCRCENPKTRRRRRMEELDIIFFSLLFPRKRQLNTMNENYSINHISSSQVRTTRNESMRKIMVHIDIVNFLYYYSIIPFCCTMKTFPYWGRRRVINDYLFKKCIWLRLIPCNSLSRSNANLRILSLSK